MATKPAVLCKLQKDQLIDTQKGFVDTFNWLVDFCSNLQGDGNIEVDTQKSDKPKIKLVGLPLISGDDTKVVLTEVKDGKNKGLTKIDVYYK